MCYKKFIRPILFRMDPERVHNAALFFGSLLGRIWIKRKVLELIYLYKDERLNLEVKGIKFDNPVGLAAGFDKNGVLTEIIPSFGFGFEEIGSITAEQCEGNKKPRVFRIPEEKGLIVNYGLPSDGAESVLRRLRKKKFKIPIGINIAKTNDSRIKGESSVEDYFKSYKLLKDIGDYITINISCPNVGDGRSFEDPKLLEKLLKKIGKTDKIIFLKISLFYAFIKISLFKFVISNLIKNAKGALSGLPVKEKADELIKYVYRKTKGRFVIIGVGGIFSAEDAYTKIRNGASLVQLVTGMIYEGPGIAKNINKGLIILLKKDGFREIKEVIGVDA